MPGTNAACAHHGVTNQAADRHFCPLKIRTRDLARLVVGVRNIMSKQRTFVTDFADTSHSSSGEAAAPKPFGEGGQKVKGWLS